MPAVKPRGKGGMKPSVYPWHDMDVGDSFLFPPGVDRSSYAAAIQASRSNSGRRFKVYKTDDGYRCWRVA